MLQYEHLSCSVDRMLGFECTEHHEHEPFMWLPGFAVLTLLRLN